MFRPMAARLAQNIVRKNIIKEDTRSYAGPPKRNLLKPTITEAIRNIKPRSYVTLAFPVTTLALGIWQIKRSFWKASMIEELEARLRKKPISLPHTLEEISALEYHPVKLKGHFDHSREIFIGPRTLLNTKRPASTLLSGGSSAGFFVYTPFKPDDRDYYILVNRGWVPNDKVDPAKRQEGQIQGEVEITGLIRLTEKKPQFGMQNEPGRNIWIYRDLQSMASFADTAPISIDATEDTTVPGGPIGGQTLINVQNVHYSYAATWIALSLLSGIIWWQNTFPHGVRFAR